MGSVASALIPPGSLDARGMSVTTATRTGGDPRKGLIYDATRFAAGVPVHFHPLDGTRYLGLFDSYWTDATPGSTVGTYSAKTVHTKPGILVIDPATGATSSMGQSADYELPLRTAYTTVDLRAATSQAQYLWVLLSVDDGAVVLAHYRISLDGQLVLVREFPIADALAANGDRITFNQGVYFQDPWIYLWGSSDVDDAVYAARAAITDLPTLVFQSDTGWTARHQDDPLYFPYTVVDGVKVPTHPDWTLATPVPGLSTVGPMSTVVLGKRTWVTTVATSGSNTVGRVWHSRSMANPWTQLVEVNLGPTSDWLGQGLILQPQLGVSSTADLAGAASVIPMVVSKASATAIDVTWSLLGIPRTLA